MRFPRRLLAFVFACVAFAGCSGSGSAPSTPPVRQPTPTPAGATPTPAGATPTPAAATPTPAHATPTPTPAGAATPTPTPAGAATPTPVPTATATGGSVGTGSGYVYYHFDPPITSTSGLLEDLNLSGGPYNDLIASNFIAGVMLGRTIDEVFPGVQYDKDYLYGTMFGQLLQENIETSLYSPSSTSIDPSALQAAVMGAGQGGPYQINNYDVDLFYGSYAPQGYALLNYVAIQKNIGFTFAQATTQFSAPTPVSFNNKYYGPMLTAFFHLNDMRALYALGGTSYSPAPGFNQCLTNLKSVANPPLDVIVNYAYNQGYYGGLVNDATSLCASSAAAFATKYDSYATAAGDSYHAYPYQVRFYLDELYNQSTIVPATNNHVVLTVSGLGTVFANVASTLAYQSGGSYSFIPSSTALGAFNAAARSAGTATSYDLGIASQRAALFTLLENAVGNLEASLGTTFSQTTLVQLGS